MRLSHKTRSQEGELRALVQKQNAQLAQLQLEVAMSSSMPPALPPPQRDNSREASLVAELQALRDAATKHEAELEETKTRCAEQAQIELRETLKWLDFPDEDDEEVSDEGVAEENAAAAAAAAAAAEERAAEESSELRTELAREVERREAAAEQIVALQREIERARAAASAAAVPPDAAADAASAAIEATEALCADRVRELEHAHSQTLAKAETAARKSQAEAIGRSAREQQHALRANDAQHKAALAAEAAKLHATEVKLEQAVEQAKRSDERAASIVASGASGGGKGGGFSASTTSGAADAAALRRANRDLERALAAAGDEHVEALLSMETRQQSILERCAKAIEETREETLQESSATLTSELAQQRSAFAADKKALDSRHAAQLQHAASAHSEKIRALRAEMVALGEQDCEHRSALQRSVESFGVHLAEDSARMDEANAQVARLTAELSTAQSEAVATTAQRKRSADKFEQQLRSAKEASASAAKEAVALCEHVHRNQMACHEAEVRLAATQAAKQSETMLVALRSELREAAAAAKLGASSVASAVDERSAHNTALEAAHEQLHELESGLSCAQAVAQLQVAKATAVAAERDAARTALHEARGELTLARAHESSVLAQQREDLMAHPTDDENQKMCAEAGPSLPLG